MGEHYDYWGGSDDDLLDLVAETLAEHRWLTTVWRCSCEPRSTQHDYSSDVFDRHARHQAEAALAAIRDRMFRGTVVSVDVSTGDDDAHVRVFAECVETQMDPSTGKTMILAEATDTSALTEHIDTEKEEAWQKGFERRSL